jgi:hypothetical protein
VLRQFLNNTPIAEVSRLVSEYIATQREKYGSRAIQLPAQQKTAMGDSSRGNFWMVSDFLCWKPSVLPTRTSILC